MLDFGLARLIVDEFSETRAELTTPGTVVGTLKYMAPEQLDAGVVDGRADLFSTGAILYEMLSGRPAFEADALPVLMRQILRRVNHWRLVAHRPSRRLTVSSTERSLRRPANATPARRPWRTTYAPH